MICPSGSSPPQCTQSGDHLPVYRTPLRLDAWRDALRWHPDSEFVNDVLSGIEFGRAVGFAGDRFQQRDCTNPKAHEEHQPKLRLIRAAEFEQGWRAGPFTGSEGPPLFNLMAHPTKAIFKRLSDKIRQVVNISYPHDESAVNRNIVRCTRLWNVSFDQAAAIAASLGHGTLMWKFDLVSAYKLVASLVQDWHLQGELEIIDGVKCYSFSTTTCFGAASSADVFHDLGSAAEFILRLAAGKVVICRYADDFIVFTPDGTDFPHADRARARIIGVCDALGLPIAKFEGPAPELVFIGSGIDMTRMRVFVPPERVVHTVSLLNEWLRKQFAREREIMSLAGQLSFISRVIRWGRPYISDLFALARKSSARIRLPASLRTSLQWWIDALTISPWVSIREFAPFQPTVVFETDASMDGIGAYSPTTNTWFSYALSQREIASAFRRKSRCMGELELRAIAMALVTFAPDLVGASILCITDNHESAVAVNNRSSKMPKIRHLINFIGITAHRHDISIRARLVPREENWRADLLSKHQVEKFLALTPGASRFATTPLSVPTLV